MIFAAAVLFVLGMALSALFSGSETGFYRMTRVRLVLDAMAGDRIARGLTWLSRRPSLFVATVLVGNNLANYSVSLAIVLAAESLFSPEGVALEILAPLALSPFVFVYGELLPKHVFHEAPYRLLRRGGPLLLLCAAAFLPMSALLWAVGKLLETVVGQSPQRVQSKLARKELKDLLDVGHEMGILRPAQAALAQGIFAVASRPVGESARPVSRFVRVRSDMSVVEARRVARRNRLSWLAVEEPHGRRNLVGYVRVLDLYRAAEDAPLPVRPLLEVPAGESHIAALIHMQNAREELARVVDEAGRTVGLVGVRHLTGPLFAERG